MVERFRQGVVKEIESKLQATVDSPSYPKRAKGSPTRWKETYTNWFDVLSGYESYYKKLADDVTPNLFDKVVIYAGIIGLSDDEIQTAIDLGKYGAKEGYTAMEYRMTVHRVRVIYAVIAALVYDQLRDKAKAQAESEAIKQKQLKEAERIVRKQMQLTSEKSRIQAELDSLELKRVELEFAAQRDGWIESFPNALDLKDDLEDILSNTKFATGKRFDTSLL